jgi:hypothetical protein
MGPAVRRVPAVTLQLPAVTTLLTAAIVPFPRRPGGPAGVHRCARGGAGRAVPGHLAAGAACGEAARVAAAAGGGVPALPAGDGRGWGGEGATALWGSGLGTARGQWGVGVDGADVGSRGWTTKRVAEGARVGLRVPASPLCVSFYATPPLPTCAPPGKAFFANVATERVWRAGRGSAQPAHCDAATASRRAHAQPLRIVRRLHMPVTRHSAPDAQHTA